MGFHIGDFAVDEPAVPEALVEVPTEAGNAVEEAEFEEVTDEEVAKVWNTYCNKCSNVSCSL